MKRKAPTWTPTARDYQQVFTDQNPWHADGKVPDAWARPVERSLVPLLEKRLETDAPRRFQLILGPRRVGKTTAMYQTVRRLLAGGIRQHRLWWLRLDHPLLMQVELGDLVKFAITTGEASVDQPLFLFLDELVYATAWDLWLKTFYDENWPVHLAGSSSSTAALRDRRLESGVGRWEEQYLAPYLFSEFLRLVNFAIELPRATTLAQTIAECVRAKLSISGLAALRRRFLLMGGFPELLIPNKDYPADETTLLLQSQRTLRNDAVERAIYKDIPQAFGVDNPLMLERLLYTLAGQVTGVLSPNTICQTLNGLSQPTFDRYLTYLERAFLVFSLPNYSGSEASRQKRGRKLYFVDGAVRNAALQRGLAPLHDAGEMGLLLENLIAGHLHALSQQSQVRLYHWRDRNDEIDLVYDHPEFPLAFEIASSSTHHRTGMQQFMARFPRFRGRCYLVAPHIAAYVPKPNSDETGTLPLDLLLLAIGVQTEKELAQRLAS
jgi:predicted AAA+ superfamily ATPase